MTTVGRMTILDPKGEPMGKRIEAAPRLDNLADKKVAVLIDGGWRSWYVFTEKMEDVVADQEPKVHLERKVSSGHAFDQRGLRLTGNKHEHQDWDGKGRERFLAEVAANVDAAVVGLGN